KLRLGDVVGQARLVEAGLAFQIGYDCLRRRIELRIIVADHRELQAAAGAAEAQAVGLTGESAYALAVGDAALNVVDDLLLAAAAFVPWRESRDDEAGILVSALSGAGIDVADLAIVTQRLDAPLDLAHLLGDIVERNALRGRNAHE